MKSTARFDARAVRDALLRRGEPDEAGFVRFAYRPFDNRWLYWEADTKLLDEKRTDYRPHVFEGNQWLSAAQHLRKGAGEPQTCFTGQLGSLHLIERTALMFPAYLRDDGLVTDGDGMQRRPNLSNAAQRYLHRLGAGVEDLFHHVLATLHDPAYRAANAGALRMEWPRIPLPDWPAPGSADIPGSEPAPYLIRGPEQALPAADAADALAQSAARGRQLAALLDPDTPVPGVTAGALRPEIAAIAVPATTDGRNMTGDDFALTAGWGHYGTGDAVMPGQGRIVEREYTPDERAALGAAIPTLGETTFDVYLNARAFWRNVPAAVWGSKLGGYQVLKKWLSYRERDVLGRALSPEEVLYFTEMARRVGALRLVTDWKASWMTR